MIAMTTRAARRLAVGVLAVLAAMLVVTCVVDVWIIRNGYGDEVDTVLEPTVWPLIAGILAAAAVGAVVAIQQPHNPIGWLFLGLAGAIMVSGPIDQWYVLAHVVTPSRVGGGDLAGTIGDKSFIPWFTLVTLILLLTPTGNFLSARWRWVGRVAIAACIATIGASLVSDAELDDYPLADNPFSVAALNPAAAWASYLLLLVVAACLVLGGISIVLRFRRAEGDARRQLLWLALVVVPLPAFVVLAFVASSEDLAALQIAATAGFVTLIPVAAGLSVLRYRLYDVERVVAATLTYSLLSVVLVGVYVGVVWFGARLAPAWSPSPVATATTGAVAAALVAGPLRRGLQDRIDRRFNKRAYDAARTVERGLASDQAGVDLTALLRAALGDPTLTISYPTPDGDWVDEAGRQEERVDGQVEVARGGRVVARIGFDAAQVDDASVTQAAALAAAELDNVRLRAELRHRLAEIAASRRRLSQAQREERRRIERDLHDGAQQTLLALAFELQAAQLNGDPGAMRDALAKGADGARSAAQELRALANGLHPAALADGGLAGVVDDLARRSPVPLEVDVDSARLDPATEFTAWLVVAEAVTNAHKHAHASRIRVFSARRDGELRLSICDDGRGGADASGSGLRGLHDRVESAGGTLRVRSGTDGTAVEVTLPCGS
jgi:signal transduction histidine kinase